jgi:hypothetical protein
MTLGRNHSYSEPGVKLSFSVKKRQVNIRTSPDVLIRRCNKDGAQSTQSTNDRQKQRLRRAGPGALTETREIGHVNRKTGEEPDDNVESAKCRERSSKLGIKMRRSCDEGSSVFGHNDGLPTQKMVRYSVGLGQIY